MSYATRLLSADAHFGARAPADLPLRDLVRLYAAGRDGIAALEPDLIGEHEILMSGDEDMVDACRAWMEALLSLAGEGGEEIADLLESVLALERRHWRRVDATLAEGSDREAAMRRGLGQVTAVGGVETRRDPSASPTTMAGVWSSFTQVRIRVRRLTRSGPFKYRSRWPSRCSWARCSRPPRWPFPKASTISSSRRFRARAAISSPCA